MLFDPGKIMAALMKKGIQEQSNTTTRIQCHEINFQNKLNLRE